MLLGIPSSFVVLPFHLASSGEYYYGCILVVFVARHLMRLPGRVIGLLKEYMHDLVEQAKQDEAASQAFGYASPPYHTDQAISDLLAILDDRIESEGVQVGLHIGFLHEMWTLCNQARTHITDAVWLEQSIATEQPSKAQTRELTYRALIEYLEHQPED